MRIITKYVAMLLALCCNFGHIEAMDTDKDYRKEIARLSKLPPNAEYNPSYYKQILDQQRCTWWENCLMSMSEYARSKITGIPQYTGDCHASAMAYLAEKLAEDENVEAVYLNMSLSVATSYEIFSFLRPDIIVRLKNGLYGLVEVMSASETYDSQKNKILQIYNNWQTKIDLTYCNVFDAKDFFKTSPIRQNTYKHSNNSPTKSKILAF